MAYNNIDLNSSLRVVIYNRCSTEELTQVDALERQVEYSRDYCMKRNWKIVQQYVESKSGTSAEHRYEYRKLFTSLSTMEYDLVVVKSQDRLMRSDLEWNLFIRELLRTGKRLYFYIENKLYNHEQDHMVYSMISKFNEFQSVLLSEKIRDAHAKRQEFKTGINICREMFGWNKIDTNVYEINEEEATAIREAFELVRGGMGFHSLANYMYEKGYRSKGTSGTRSMEPRMISPTWWRKNCIYDPRMHGTIIMNKDTMNFWTKKREKNPKEEWVYYENALPAIVSKEYQEETIAMLKSREYKAKHCDRTLIGKHMYSNKIKCKSCGCFYYREKIKSGRNGELINWKCAKQKQLGHAYCDNIIIEENTLNDLIENYAVSKFSRVFKKSTGIVEKAMKYIKIALNDNVNKNLLEDLNADLQKQRKKKDILFNKLMDGVISDADFVIYNEKQEKEIDRLEEKINSLKRMKYSYTDYEAKLERIRAALADGMIEKDAVVLQLKKIIETVEVDSNSHVTIAFEKDKLYELLGLYHVSDIVEKIEGSLYTMEFDYYRENKVEKKRRITNQKVLELFSENPNMTIAECAKMLGMSYSYIYTSVSQLRKAGELEHRQLTFDTGMWMVKQGMKHTDT